MALDTRRGTPVPVSKFLIASPGTPVALINAAFALGRSLLLTPGVYDLRHAIEVTRPGTVVLGLGFPTLVPQNRTTAMRVASVPGVKLSGMIFDAGPVNSPVLLQVGGLRGGSVAAPTLVQDVFFQNEMPYDPPDQASWTAGPATDGYPAFAVSPKVTSFQGYGLASYCFFELGVPIEASTAFIVPNAPGVQLHDILTRFLNGSGGIQSVVNGTGAPVTQAQPGPSDVVSYP